MNVSHGKFTGKVNYIIVVTTNHIQHMELSTPIPRPRVGVNVFYS